jgi:hypothetical protein
MAYCAALNVTPSNETEEVLAGMVGDPRTTARDFWSEIWTRMPVACAEHAEQHLTRSSQSSRYVHAVQLLRLGRDASRSDAMTDQYALELLANLDIAVGGIADHPLGTSVLGLLVDQLAGVMPIVLVSRLERDRRQDWYLSLGDGVHLLAGELLDRSLATMTHFRVVRGDDLTSSGSSTPS